MLVFLLLVLPTQFVWAAAAPYCAHESSPTAKKHYGHHEHHHQADQQANAGDGPDQTLGGDPDCGTCHLGVSVPVPMVAVLAAMTPSSPVLGPPSAGFRSYVPAGPERPDRTRDAAAARFDGGVVFGQPPA
ncbi:hypothetical protein ACS5PM_12095 [Ideonella sp. YS5]